MTFEVKEPVLVVGLGGAGIKLASEMKEVLGADSLKISQDKKDVSEDNSIHISTKSCLLYTSPSPRDLSTSRMPSSA